MAARSSILARTIPWTEEPGGLHSPWGLKNRTRQGLNHHYHHQGPPWGLSRRHPNQEESAWRAESRGGVPKTDGWGQRPTEPPLPAPEASTMLLLDLGECPALARAVPSPNVPPNFFPASSSGYHRGQDSSFPPESISRCCLYTSICSALRGMLPRGDRRNGSPSQTLAAVTASCLHSCCACAS